MPFTKLTIRLGGLCMLVERTNPPGLFVLMPSVPAGHGHIAPHCPTVLVPQAHTGENHGWRLSFQGQAADHLGDLADPAPGVGPFDWVANVSAYTGGCPVADQWLTAKPPAGPLAARIRLPIGTKPTPVGRRAKMRVPDHAAPGQTKQVELYGRAEATITVAEPNSGFLEIAGRRLLPDRNGEIVLHFLNVPAIDLENPKQHGHAKGSRAEHAETYYQLLAPACTAASGFPPILIDEEVSGDPPPHGGPECPPDGPWRERDFAAKFIDPYNCTMGGGT